jgi:membrane-associated phospholipid phosphatase
MRPFERLAAAYFVVVAVSAWLTDAPRARRLRAILYAGLVLVLLAAAAWRGSPTLRAWLPHAYLVFGYWLPAVLTRGVAHPRFEAWLQRTDERIGVRLVRRPSWLSHCLELAYLLCYPLVPSAFAVVFARGASPDVDRFWEAVLLSGYACYVTLPWLTSRPPRLLSAATDAARGVAAVNAFVLGRVSHQLTTFPSGHAAVSVASALSVASVSGAAGMVFGLLAASIAVAAVVGRYHYAIDVLLGVLIGMIAWTVAGASAGGR